MRSQFPIHSTIMNRKKEMELWWYFPLSGLATTLGDKQQSPPLKSPRAESVMTMVRLMMGNKIMAERNTPIPRSASYKFYCQPAIHPECLWMIRTNKVQNSAPLSTHHHRRTSSRHNPKTFPFRAQTKRVFRRITITTSPSR